MRAKFLGARRIAKVGEEGDSVIAAAGASVTLGRTKRTSALDRSTEMGGPVAADDGGDSV